MKAEKEGERQVCFPFSLRSILSFWSGLEGYSEEGKGDMRYAKIDWDKGEG